MASDVRELTLDAVRSLAKRGTRDLRLLAVTIFCVSFGFGTYFATFNNFVVQSLDLQPQQLGILEAAREMPGFLMFLIAALTMTVAEPILASIALMLVATGVAAYCRVNSLTSLLLFSLVWSIGLHVWMPLSPSMVLNLSDESNKGRRLGQMNSVAAIGTICGMCLVFILGKYIGFKNIFLIAGCIAGLGAVSVSFIRRNIGHAEKPRFVFKRRYSLYYLLTFLEGCRKQVFITFAIFALVRNYGTPLRVVAALMIFNNLINFILAPKVGRLIDRIGERRVLAFCYAALIPVFIGYATIKRVPFLYVLYCLDNLFFLGSIGLNTYLHRICSPEDLMPSLVMGVSVNHAAAVAVPLIGGFLWSRLGYQATFFGGAVVVALSVLVALSIKAANPAHA